MDCWLIIVAARYLELSKIENQNSTNRVSKSYVYNKSIPFKNLSHSKFDDVIIKTTF